MRGQRSSILEYSHICTVIVHKNGELAIFDEKFESNVKQVIN